MVPPSIRELKQAIGPVPRRETIHVQLEAALKKTTRSGNPFYEMRFVDAEEQLVLRVWSDTPMFPTCEQLRENGFYELAGDFALGNDGRSVDAKQWQVRSLEPSEIELLLAGTGELREKQEADYHYIEKTVSAVGDPRLRALGDHFLTKYGERFRRTAGARDYHHARRGGLVEHVAQMMRAACQVCEAYPSLNRDLLVIGVLFHDVGKLWENVYSEKGFTMPYTEVSELIGHIPMGMEIVNQLWRTIRADENLSEDWDELEPHSERVRLHLLHLIVSHHGELAFGSPVVPKTPEAQALHYIDNLDAKMEMFERGYLVAAELGRNVYQRVAPLVSSEPVSPEPSAGYADEAGTEQGEGEPGDGLPIPVPDDDEPF